jgi:hypothetical protein
MTDLPLIGGFNDGKFIDPSGRNTIKMARPPSYDNSVSHYESMLGFEYEIYSLETIKVHGKIFKFYVIEGMKLPEVFEKLIFGYKQYNKRKALDLINE